MKPSYLKSASIFGFRVFPESGAHFDFPAPGITVLVGQNGLGKSSLFEAIEWTLTGRVERLEQLSREVVRKENVPPYYARRSEGKLADEISVSLSFDVDDAIRQVGRRWERIHGSDRFKPASPTSDDDVRAVLCDDAWNVPIDKLGSYLRDTHFLVQSTGNRWAASPPKERWERIEGPAGFSRLEHVRSGLGKATDLAFSRIIKECRQRLEEANRKLGEWRETFAQSERERAVAAQTGAFLSADQIRLRTEALVKDLVETTREFSRAPTLVYAGGVADLDAIRALIRDADRIFIEREKLLGNVADIPDKIQTAFADLDSVRGDIGRHADTIKKLEQEFITAGRQLEAVKTELPIVKKRSAEARYALVRVQNLKKSFEERPRLTSSLEELQGLVAQAEKDLTETSLAVEEAKTAVGNASEAQRKQGDASERMDRYRRLYARVSTWAKDVPGIQAKRVELTELRLSQTTSVARLVDAHRRVSVALDAEKAARERFVKAQGQRDETSKLVSNILASITRDHGECPVCHTLFEPGELLRRATNGIAAMDPLVGEAQSQYAAAADEIASANKDVAEIVSYNTRLADRIAELTRAVLAHDAELASLRATDVIGDLTAETADDLLEQLVSLRQSSKLDAELYAHASDDVMILREELTQKEGKWKNAEAELSRLRRKAGETRLRLQTIDEASVEQKERVEAWTRNASKIDVDIAIASQSAVFEEAAEQEISRQHRALNKDVDELKERKNEAARRGEAYDRLVRERTLYLDALRGSWSETGLPGDIDPGNIERLRQTMNRGRERLAGLVAQERRLVEDIEQMHKSTEYERSETRIRNAVAEANYASGGEFLSALELQVTRAEEEVGLAVQAQELSKKLSDRLKAEAKEYAQNVMDPLSRLANRFHLALSPFPERVLNLGVKAAIGAGSALSLNVQPHREQPEPEDLSALLLLSEGQLSEASLSFLFGMSTIYRWSRWRALLLDDPLQQNDIVHASSFVDVARRLVLDDGYQMIVSTHDSDLADFIVRKARAGGVRCALYRFLNPGRAEADSRGG